tara:strand:+ start:212 stop:529 length:318 start_codon:yes stop_codon:yes gene_type:complete
MNSPQNENDPLRLNNDITLLNTEVDAASSDVANGKQVNLTEFQAKVSIFCDLLNTNPPPESDTPKILESIELLLKKINNLQDKLTKLETSKLEKENTSKVKKDVI